MNKDIKFKKNPKPSSILLATLRPYIIPQCLSSSPSFTPISFLLSSPLSLRTLGSPEMLLFSPSAADLLLKASKVAIQAGVGIHNRDNTVGERRLSSCSLAPPRPVVGAEPGYS